MNTESQFILDKYKFETKGIFHLKFPSKSWINRKKYKGKGRPKKEDYYTGIIGSQSI